MLSRYPYSDPQGRKKRGKELRRKGGKKGGREQERGGGRKEGRKEICCNFIKIRETPFNKNSLKTFRSNAR